MAAVFLSFCTLLASSSEGGEAIAARVSTVDGKIHEGAIESWRADGALVLKSREDQPVKIDAKDVDHAAFPPRSKEEPDGAWAIETKNGDRLFGDIAGGGEDKLTVQHHQLGEISLPLDRLAAVIRGGKSLGGRPDRTVDSVLLVNGDVNNGAITAIDQDGVSIFSNDAEQTRSWSVIKAILFAESPVSRKPAPAVRLSLADDSNVAVSALKREGRSMQLVLTNGQTVQCDAGFITRAEMVGGRRVWLSELQIESPETRRFFGRTWPIGFDTNTFGEPLRIAGTEYARGLGLHSACRLQWRLDGKYERFTGWVGMDDSAGRWADADLAVSVDGKRMVQLSGLRQGAEPQKIDIGLKGKQVLVIEVGFGRYGETQDRVDLVNPALIRTPSSAR